MKVRLFILSLLLMCLFERAYSGYSYTINGLTLYYGTRYRFDECYRHSFSIDRWDLWAGCTRSRYKGMGLSSEFSDTHNYSFGIRYFKSPQRHPAAAGFIFYLGLEPTAYAIADHWGFNAAPEAGFHLSSLYDALGVSVNLFYGYDIPFVNQNTYTMNRHHITLKIGLDIDTRNVKDLFKKDEEKIEAKF